MMPRCRISFVLVAAMLTLVSCGKSGPTKYAVSGTVEWNGQPLESGDITFVPKGAGQLPDQSDIRGGRYELLVQAGSKKVEIHATRTVGEVDPSMGAANREQYIPARFNSQSELSAEVTPDGPKEFDFTLTDDK